MADRPETIKADLQRVLDRMAQVYVAGDAAACAAMFTPDADLFSPYAPPARGRREIEALHRVWTDGATAKSFRVVDAGGSGDLAWARAIYSEGDVTEDGTTLCVFERAADGIWRIRSCSLNEITPE